MPLAGIGITIVTEPPNSQLIFYCCGAFLGPLFSHHFIYQYVIGPRIANIPGNGLLLWSLQPGNKVINYLLAVLIGFGLALEMHRTRLRQMIPLTLPMGVVMGVVSMLVIYALVLISIAFWSTGGLIAAMILGLLIAYGLRPAGTNSSISQSNSIGALGGSNPSASGNTHSPTRDSEFETFRLWMGQLNHEDYLLVSRAGLSLISQPVFALGYVFSRYFSIGIVSEILIWSNLIISVIIFISILAALRVYVEIRVKLRPILERYPDFPMRRLPNIRPGLGLYCPVGVGLIVVLIWSSLLYVEAAGDPFRQIAAIIITVFLGAAGVIAAIGVGLGLEEKGESHYHIT